MSRSDKAHGGPVIRRALPEDVGAIATLTDEAYAKYVPRMGRKPEPMTADYRRVVAEHPVWILCLEERPVGVLVLMAEPEQMLIYSVAIRPGFQGRGLGRQLLAWAEHEARRAGYRRVRLYTNALMESNQALYRRLGYVETGRESREGSTLVHMAKELAGAGGEPPAPSASK